MVDAEGSRIIYGCSGEYFGGGALAARGTILVSGVEQETNSCYNFQSLVSGCKSDISLNYIGPIFL